MSVQRSVDPPSLAARLRRLIKGDAFLTTRWSMLSNPVYIARSGLLRAIRELAPRIEGDVLDFGCGSKPYETLFSRAHSYLGVDIEVSGHDHKDSKVDVFYDGHILPFASGHFDAIVCFEVLEHVFDIDAVLTELKRVLKDDGALLLSVPFAWDEHEVPYDFARYTSYGLRHIMAKNGYEVIELKKTTTYVLAVCQMMIAFFYQHVLPRNAVARGVLVPLFIFPMNLLSFGLDALLPRRSGYFCNSVLLCRKMPGSTLRA